MRALLAINRQKVYSMCQKENKEIKMKEGDEGSD